MAVNRSFKNNWHWFLIGAAITSLIVSIGVSIRCKPTSKERILYYICSSKVDTSALVKESKASSDDSIREIRINHESFNESSNSRLFGMVYSISDIFIYPESQLERTAPLSIHFAKEVFSSYVPNSTNKDFYFDKESYCAIKIYNSNTDEGLLNNLVDFKSINPSEDYYLSLSKTSLHIGELNSCSSDNVLKVVNHLLEL
jgi:hypothetical protein